MTNQIEPNLQKSIEHLDNDLEKLDRSIDQLDDTLEKSLEVHGVWPTFGRGIIGALGAAIGGALVITAIVYILQGLTGVPFIGHYVDRLIQGVQQNK